MSNNDELINQSEDFGQVVIRSIAEYNENAFCDLFTKEALSSSDFKKGKAYLFDIFEGEIQSTKHIATSTGGEYSKYGKSTILTVIYEIITDENEYMLYFEYYQKSPSYIDKIKRLRLAIKSELPETGGFNNNGGMGSHEGIYYPEINFQ